MQPQSLRAIWQALAIVTTMVVMAIFLYITPAQAAIPIKPESAYSQGVASMYKQAESEADSPTGKAFKDVLDQLFKPQAVQIPFRFITQKAQAVSTVYSGNIYFSQGAIFIGYDQSEHDDHFATINSKLYTWKTGETQGEILKRFPGDTLAFVMYMIDPSALMRSVYVEYLDKPEQFTVKAKDNQKKSILFKQVKDGFKGIEITEKPFWLNAFLLELPQEKGGDLGRLEVDAPIALEAIPDELLSLPKGISFKPSQETLRNRMTYL